jgi:hypothetical protein
MDLNPTVHVDAGPPRRVRCYVQDCKEWLRPASKTPYYIGDICPAHGIRCHSSGTYSYVDARRNIIVAPDLFASRILENADKYDTKHMGNEKSEDALTWNVFRTLQECSVLHVVAQLITGQEVSAEPYLYLWGLSISDETFKPWDLLLAARERFESNLPVERPKTEPDIALYLPGHYLILIEAKFTSPNPFYTDGPRRDTKSLTKNELLDIYQDAALQILDVQNARQAERVYYQLWRNMIFAEWMALAEGCGTSAYHANLTRAGNEDESCEHFRGLINLEFAGRFVHLSWEEIYLRSTDSPELSRLRGYIEAKTAGLLQSFSFPRSPINLVGREP